MFFIPAYMRAVTQLLTANHYAEPAVHGEPEGSRVENAWHSR